MREAEESRFVAVVEELGVSAPVDDCEQRPLGIVLVQMVLQLELEPRPGRAVALAFLEHAMDMRGKRSLPASRAGW
jgi:hypothetical protein